jgi:hypothetical protein
MKYLEELKHGDKFTYKDYCFVLTCDYKQSKNTIQKLCINLHNGNILWLNDDTIVYQIFIFYQNQDNLLVDIKNETHN